MLKEFQCKHPYNTYKKLLHHLIERHTKYISTSETHSVRGARARDQDNHSVPYCTVLYCMFVCLFSFYHTVIRCYRSYMIIGMDIVYYIEVIQ